MGSMPVQCTSCGRRFLDPRIQMQFVINSTFDITLDCPYCGGKAKMIEGTMNVSHTGEIELLSGPQWSWDLLDALRRTLERVVENPPDDPIAAVAQVSPELATQVDAATKQWSRGDKMALLALILALLSADYSNVTLAVGAVADLIREVLESGRLPGS